MSETMRKWVCNRNRIQQLDTIKFFEVVCDYENKD